MTPPIRILDTGVRSARWNVAMTAALAERHAAGSAPDTIRFHRYERCVLLGRSQIAADAVDRDYCRRGGIAIAHRVTGGGAVYMSPEMLAWDVVVERRMFGGDLDLAARRICEGVAAGLCRLGCAARFRPANDIECGRLKVSGSSGYSEGRSIALQGTVLIEDEVPEMSRALRIPERALREKVTCVAAILGEAPALALLQESIGKALSAALGRLPEYCDASAVELAAAERLLDQEMRLTEGAA